MATWLYVGIESYKWADSKYSQVLDFLVANDIDGAFIKVYEIEDGEWVTDADWKLIADTFKAKDKMIVPYGYFYGGNGIVQEANTALHWLNSVGSFCIDAEQEFDGQTGLAQQLSSILSGHTGKLYLTSWANPADHNWIQLMHDLDSVVQVWMPQIYSDNLLLRYQEQYPKVQGKVVPILSVTGDGDPNHPDQIINDGAFTDIAIWELQTAQQNVAQADSMVSDTTKGSDMILNDNETVMSLLSGSQFEPNETEFACGYFAGGVAKFAYPPKQSTTHTWEDVDQFADGEYKKVYGDAGPTRTGGISIDELHTVLHNATGLHYWDMNISPTSAQSQDIEGIKAAVNAGYLVVATVIESSVRDVTGDITPSNPYEWNPVCTADTCPTHVLVWCGVRKSDGALLAWDYANVVGPLQGNNTVRKLPRAYDVGPIDNTFATIVQVVGPDANNPWLKPIPSGDPLSWPKGFNAQNFTETPVTTPPTKPPTTDDATKRKAFNAEWTSIVKDAKTDSGIALAAYADYWTDKFHGPPHSEEFQLTVQGGAVFTAQTMGNGIYIWKNHQAEFFPYH